MCFNGIIALLGGEMLAKEIWFCLLLRYAFLFIFLFHFNRFLRNYRPYIIRAMYEIAQSHRTQGNLSNHFPENAESFEFLMLCQRRFYSSILSWHSPKIIWCTTRAPCINRLKVSIKAEIDRNS